MGSACAGEGKPKDVEQVPDEAPAADESPKGPEDNPDEPKLLLTVVGARGMRNADWLPGAGKSDCYCIVKYKSNEILKTKTINNSLEPIWMEEVAIPDYEDGESLEFFFFDKDLVGSDSLGKVTLTTDKFAEAGLNGEVKIEDAGKPTVQAFLKLKIKVKGKDLPAGPPTEVKLTVDKASAKSYGLDLDTQDVATLFLLDVNKGGACKNYNDANPDELQLRKFDFIMSVNGVTGDAPGMLDQFRSAEKAEIVIRRPQEMAAIITTTDSKPLGLEFPQKPVGEHLVIAKVNEGAVWDWNQDQPEDGRIKSGDRIVSVSGKVGKSTELKNELEKPGQFQLTLMRPGNENTQFFWRR